MVAAESAKISTFTPALPYITWRQCTWLKRWYYLGLKFNTITILLLLGWYKNKYQVLFCILYGTAEKRRPSCYSVLPKTKINTINSLNSVIGDKKLPDWWADICFLFLRKKAKVCRIIIWLLLETLWFIFFLTTLFLIPPDTIFEMI